jgi:hypothetical protein
MEKQQEDEGEGGAMIKVLHSTYENRIMKPIKIVKQKREENPGVSLMKVLYMHV